MDILPNPEVINATPHPLNICVEGEQVLYLPVSGVVARAASATQQYGEITVNGVRVPLFQTRFGALEGLPEPREGVVYVVSALAAAAAPERNDLLTPGPLVRDEAGVVIGCNGLNKP